MPVLEIVKYPAPVLLQRAEEVREVDGALQKQIDEMIETLYAAPGLGLAAPQVGDSRRFFVYDLSVQEEEPVARKGPLVVLNPEILEMEGEEVSDEGCLSIPGYHEKVKRAYRVLLRGLDREGKEIRIEGEGLLARLFQHEVDHINGVLMVERFSSLKKDIFFRKFKKMLKQGESF
ncbi:peptide deformylase [Candidatus Manganitrophus noduliformans]|uniref:Peptide deformylase n=1 Tax=Candidatus Manganitrophus noduliformans TaxID=2606439 RepID=A0A7X6DNM6_9BACT|nr:peptide deformylase [Candidatus Manganitrophus noduliformans]NKE70542.1 peptide deformylase [Candidatus Manganitrophus noduliformans]